MIITIIETFFTVKKDKSIDRTSHSTREDIQMEAILKELNKVELLTSKIMSEDQKLQRKTKYELKEEEEEAKTTFNDMLRYDMYYHKLLEELTSDALL